MKPSQKAGEITRVSIRSGLNVENEQADAGRDGRTRLAGPNSQAQTGTGKVHFPRSPDLDQILQPYPFGSYSAESTDYT